MVPGNLQTVHRVELWGVILAVQGSTPVHLELDDIHVVRHVSRIKGMGRWDRPFDLFVDGDLLALTENILLKRGRETESINKVQGHADDTMVWDWRVYL